MKEQLVKELTHQSSSAKIATMNEILRKSKLRLHKNPSNCGSKSKLELIVEGDKAATVTRQVKAPVVISKPQQIDRKSSRLIRHESANSSLQHEQRIAVFNSDFRHIVDSP